VPDFPGGSYASISTSRCKYSVSGKKFINQGAKPNIEIYSTIDDILEQNDVVLEKALEVMRGKMQE